MTIRVELAEAQRRLAALVAAIATEGPVIIEQNGAPVAALVAAHRPSRMPAEDLFALIQELQQRHADLDPDELEREITVLVEEVRQEMYEERRRARAEGRA